MGKFDGKVAVITGGASGLGRAVALGMVENGAKVAIFDIDEPATRQVVADIEKNGGQALGVSCDVSDEPRVKAGFQQVVDAFGRVDILHINTGIIYPVKFITELTLEDWNRIVGINLTGSFLTAKYGITRMLEQGGGTIVFTGSNWAYVCDPGFSSYAATKAGVVALARTLALDHAKDNIRINVVCPGNMMTPLLEKQLSVEPDPKATLESMGQISTPEEVANLVMFLASDESSAMKGSAVIVDQGETLGYGPGLKVRR